ncbi:hypothetical protein [Aquabacterium sp.]|uniref:hypothetical protein n=1 Tax=Aquabacterium sp. TaxID=1872578 RepID=UPI0040384833
MGELQAYRTFREEVLKKAEKFHKPPRGNLGWNTEDEHPLQRKRQVVRDFRDQVASSALALLAANPDGEPLIRRALRLPQRQRLVPTGWTTAGQVALFFLPDMVLLQRAIHVLRSVGSFEGRKFVFNNFFKGAFPNSFDYYSEELDFLVMRMGIPSAISEWAGLCHLGLEELKTARRLGMVKPVDVARHLPPGFGRPVASILWVLADEGVIVEPGELAWLGRHERQLWHQGPNPSELMAVRQVIRLLLEYGVTRQLVARSHQMFLGYMDPGALAQNLALLKDRNVLDISGVFDTVGKHLWRTPTPVWRFLLDDIGARCAADIGLFEALLDSHKTVSTEVVQALFEMGADLKTLSRFIPLLKHLARSDNDVALQVSGLSLLSSPPHRLIFEQLALCESYLGERRDLVSFLAVLAMQGFGNSHAVLAFQSCYANLSAPFLDRWLTIADDRVLGEPFELVADWALRAGKGGYFESFEYLVDATDINSLTGLLQALKLAPLGKPMLRYLVEDRGMRRLKAMLDWYHNDAPGLHGYRGWHAFDALDKVLLDDAYGRRQFSRLADNQSCIASGVRERVEAEIGRFPYKASEEERQAYRLASTAAQEPARQALLPLLPHILNRTGGVLLPSLITCAYAGVGALDERLDQLVPMLNDLVEGRGPPGDALSEAEADAVALVYRISVDTVTTRWHEVVGREADMAHLKLPQYYPMAWRHAQWQLRKPLDRAGFATLFNAAAFAQRFAPGRKRDIREDCRHLSPKRLLPATELHTLAGHLGSLLAIAHGDEAVSQWLMKGFEALLGMDEDSMAAYQRMGELVALFDVVLPDALEAHLDRYVQRLSSADALHWAIRLGAVNASDDGDGHRRLKESICDAKDVVLPRFLTWARQQRDKFELAEQDTQNVTAVRATISKYPAAFFAKSTVGLCTAGNVAMWQEQRQSHLLAFDPAGRRLVGMALVYVEPIAALAVDGDSLVIRAINPTDEMLAEHTADSITESFLDVAIQVAQANGLACVAFPAPTGMHYLSNKDAIVAYIKGRYIKRAVSIRDFKREGPGEAKAPLRSRPQQITASFDAYERGSPERSDTLFVIWRKGEEGEGAYLQERLAAA